MSRIQLPATKPTRPHWNRDRLIGQKRPLLPRQVWSIRARVELAGNLRDLTSFASTDARALGDLTEVNY